MAKVGNELILNQGLNMAFSKDKIPMAMMFMKIVTQGENIGDYKVCSVKKEHFELQVFSS